MQDERSEETYASSSKRKKFVSKVWNDFKKVKKDGKDKAVCLHCQKEFVGSSKSGTTHLKNHLSRCPVTKDGETQKKMITTCLETGVGEDFVFDNERSHLDMARMILKHGYSLDMIEHEFFQIFVKNLQPRFKPYSQDTLKADILHVYKEEKEKLYKYLGTLSCHFSLMIQFWTCHRKNNAYCCFALQFLEDGLILKKKILALKKLDQCNDIEARTLFGIVISLLQEWNIDKKLCSVTLRSSCSNDKMVQDLGIWLRNRAFQLPIYGYFFHIHCTTDIINLLFQDGLNEMAGMLHKVRNAVRYVNEATLRCKLDFKYTLEQHNFQGKYSTRFEDVSTRWDSTFLKLESALELKELFSLLEGNDHGFKDLNLSVKEWDMVTIVYKYLKVLYNAICSFLGSKCLTANVYFPKVCGIHFKLFGLQKCEHAYVHSMVARMEVKFDKYFNECGIALAIAVILDPSKRFEYVQFAFEKLYDQKAFEKNLAHIQNAFNNIFNYYEKEFGMPALSSSLTDHNGNSFTSDLDDGDYDMLNSSWCEKIRCNKVASRSELDRYLAAPRILVNGDFDILSWWRTNSSEFPILGKMALDILPIPMSTCALISSYSSFSIDATTTVINPAFNDFDPDIIEALVCGEDWLDKSTKKAPNKEDKHCSGYTFNGEPTDHDHASMALVVPFSSSKPDQEKSDSANIRLVFTSPNSKYIVEDLIFGEDWLDKSTKKAPNKDDKHSSSCSLNGGSTDHDHTSMALIAPSLSNSELDQEKPDSANTKLIASPNSIDITDALIFGDDWLVKDTKKAPNNEHEHSSGYTFNREPIDHDCTSMALFSHSLRCSQSDKEKSDSPFAANTTIVHASPNTSIPAPKIICPQNLSITIPQQPLCPHAFHSPTRAPLGESFVNDRHSIEKAKLLKHLFGD